MKHILAYFTLAFLSSFVNCIDVFTNNSLGNSIDVIKSNKVVGLWDYKPGKEHSCRYPPTISEADSITQRLFTIVNNGTDQLSFSTIIKSFDRKEMAVTVEHEGVFTELKPGDKQEIFLDYGCKNKLPDSIGWGRVELAIAIKRNNSLTNDEEYVFSMLKVCQAPNQKYDPSIFILMAASVVAVIIGAYQVEKPIVVDSQEQTQEISQSHAIFFIVLGSASLIGMFLFYEDIESVLLGFVLISAFTSTTILLEIIIEKLLQWSHVENKSCKIPVLDEIQLSSVLSACISLLIIIGYVLTKSWILSNIIAVCIVIIAFKVIRLKSYMVAALLLSLAFFYDIFWVFYSDKVFGTSVMASVATRVELPMMFYCPKLSPSPYSLCSLIGLGDILLPGIFVAYCLYFDKHIGKTSKYFDICLGGYVLGLLICVICLTVFHTAQPALLYLSPCTLIPVGITGLIRGEFKVLWEGRIENQKIESPQQIDQRLPFQPLEVSE